jgi:hypothetical protein
MQESKLRHDPFEVLQEQESPYAFWIRRHLMELDSQEDQKLRRRLIIEVLGGQSEDGSFNDKVSDTVEGLFKLLLLRGPRDKGRKGVDWLMEKPWETTSSLYGCALFNRMTSEDIHDFQERRDLLFNYGCSAFINTAAVIHFAGYFGSSDTDRVDTAIKCLKKIARTRNGLFCSPYCSDNILRAFLKHPFTKDCSTSRRCVKAMESLLLEEGGWRNCAYPYHTFNAIAQSPTQSAKLQITKTLPKIIHSQNADGTWGKDYYRDFATFLVLDGLNEQGLLKDLLPEA